MNTIKKSAFILLALLGILVSACGGQKAPPAPAEFLIEMSEYAFSPTAIQMLVGQQVTITVVNKGVLPHEIMFGREVKNSAGNPSGYSTDMFTISNVQPIVTEVVSHEEDQGEDSHSDDDHDEEAGADHGFMVEISENGNPYTIEFTVTEEMLGEWEIGCFLLDGVHYSSGMVGTLTVTE